MRASDDVADLHAYPGPATPPLENVPRRRARRVRRARPAARGAHLARSRQLGLPQLHVARARPQRRLRQPAVAAAAQHGRRPGRRHLHADHRRRGRGQRRDDIRSRGREAVARGGRRQQADVRRRAGRARRPARVRSRRRRRGTTRRPRRLATGCRRRSTTGRGRAAPAGSGRVDTRFARVGTEWKTSDIWMRRTFDSWSTWTSPARTCGCSTTRMRRSTSTASSLPCSRAALPASRSCRRPARRVPPCARAAISIAVHVKQTRGGQFADVGIVDVQDR